MLQTSLESLPLPLLLKERARSMPERVFLRTVDGQELSYLELEDRVRAWMSTLARANVKAAANVVVMLPNGVDAIALWMAAARIGATEVPINTAYVGNILRHVVNDSDAECLVVHDRFLERFAAIQDELPKVKEIIVVGNADPETNLPMRISIPLTKAEGIAAEADLSWHKLACIVYTSGTTGPSKGVMISWRQMCETARWCIPIEDIAEADVWYSPWALYHVSGKLSFCGAAAANASLVIKEAFSTRDFWEDIRKFGCTTTMLVGAAIKFLEDRTPGPADREHTLRNVFVCPLPSNPQRFIERFGVRICTVFNMTETSCPIVTGWQLGPGDSCGRVRPGAECRVVDEFDEEVPPGVVGELIVRSDRPWELMMGYWNRPDATVAAWRNQWLHTGDAVRRDAEGNYFFVDRMKYAIRRRGENLSSIELEAEVNAHPDVSESAAIGVPSEWGEEDIKLFIVTKSGRSIDPRALLEFLTPRVPRFMLPRYIVNVDAIPKTHTFRARKEELRAFPIDERTWDANALNKTAANVSA